MLFAQSSFPDSPRLDTKKALILLDFQEDFVNPAGKLYTKNIATFLPKIQDLVAQFRNQGEVVWSRTDFREPRPVSSPETGGFVILLNQFTKFFDEQASSAPQTPQSDDVLACQYDDAIPPVDTDAEAFLAADLPSGTSRCCVPGTWGSNFANAVEGLINKQKDIVLPKSDYSAFADMSLVFQLRTRMVTDLYICGSLSNISVYATVLDAVRHGFSVTIVEDCVGYRSESCHISAMRQMADNMCAEGTDYQELMDDLAGLLGDVIKEETYTTKFQVDLPRSAPQSSSPQTVNHWLPGTLQQQEREGAERHGSHPALLPTARESLSRSSSIDLKTTRNRSSTIESSPPRKRSTNDIDDDLIDYQSTNLPPLSASSSSRRQSYEAYARPGSREKKPRIRVRRREGPETPRRSRPSPPQQSRSTDGIPDTPTSPTLERKPDLEMTSEQAPPAQYMSRKMAKKLSQATLGPGDQIGDGTSSVVYNMLSDDYTRRAFDQLRTNVRWQKMYHRTGEVPRLVAVQGDVTFSECGRERTYPVYRHPSDESPELLPFDHTVDVLRRECEKHVGHPLNHVLIQHYRNSEDNISEHSDKTLDIVRGSGIVNLSLGAQRTMTLRTKKAAARPDAAGLGSPFLKSDTSVTEPGGLTATTARTTQRIPLPNASLFILSTSTNAKFLHAIRADKRPVSEKSAAELAFNGERISLTFRHIGTFLTETEVEGEAWVSDRRQSQRRPTPARVLIWGQGATGKTRDRARPVLQPMNIQVGASVSKSEEINSKQEHRTSPNSSQPPSPLSTAKAATRPGTIRQTQHIEVDDDEEEDGTEDFHPEFTVNKWNGQRGPGALSDMRQESRMAADSTSEQSARSYSHSSHGELTSSATQTAGQTPRQPDQTLGLPSDLSSEQRSHETYLQQQQQQQQQEPPFSDIGQTSQKPTKMDDNVTNAVSTTTSTSTTTASTTATATATPPKTSSYEADHQDTNPSPNPHSPETTSEADTQANEMLTAFGKENHQDDRTFSWTTIYGRGFDVVNFVTRSV